MTSHLNQVQTIHYLTPLRLDFLFSWTWRKKRQIPKWKHFFSWCSGYGIILSLHKGKTSEFQNANKHVWFHHNANKSFIFPVCAEFAIFSRGVKSVIPFGLAKTRHLHFDFCSVLHHCAKKATFWTPLHSRYVLLSIRTSKQYRHQRTREHLHFYFKYVHAQYTKSSREGIPPETVMLSNESCFETPVKDPPPIAFFGLMNLRTGESKARRRRRDAWHSIAFCRRKKTPLLVRPPSGLNKRPFPFLRAKV